MCPGGDFPILQSAWWLAVERWEEGEKGMEYTLFVSLPYILAKRACGEWCYEYSIGTPYLVGWCCESHSCLVDREACLRQDEHTHTHSLDKQHQQQESQAPITTDRSEGKRLPDVQWRRVGMRGKENEIICWLLCVLLRTISALIYNSSTHLTAMFEW